MPQPSVVVEFYGIPRLRAGVDRAEVAAASLGEVVQRLADQYPQLAAACFQGDRLHPAYTANLNGQRFVRDPRTPLADGDVVLILSAEAGG